MNAQCRVVNNVSASGYIFIALFNFILSVMSLTREKGRNQQRRQKAHSSSWVKACRTNSPIWRNQEREWDRWWVDLGPLDICTLEWCPLTSIQTTTRWCNRGLGGWSPYPLELVIRWVILDIPNILTCPQIDYHLLIRVSHTQKWLLGSMQCTKGPLQMDGTCIHLPAISLHILTDPTPRCHILLLLMATLLILCFLAIRTCPPILLAQATG